MSTPTVYKSGSSSHGNYGEPSANVYGTTNSNISELSDELFFSTGLPSESEEEQIQRAILESSVIRLNPDQLFGIFLQEAFSANPNKGEPTLLDLLKVSSLTPRERCYLLCEKAYLQLNRGDYTEAVRTARLGLAEESLPLHKPYLFSLMGSALYFLNKYKEALETLGKSPTAASPRSRYYLLEKITLIHMKEHRFGKAEESLAQAKQELEKELTPPQFPLEQTLSSHAANSVYVQMIQEEKRSLLHRFEQTTRILSLFNGHPEKAIAPPPSPGHRITSEVSLQDTLLSLYAALIQDKIKEAKKFEAFLLPGPETSEATKATVNYLRSLLFIYRGDGEQGFFCLQQTLTSPLLIPMSDEEKLFCRLLLTKNQGNRSEALALYQRLIETPSLAPQTKEKLQLQKIEFASESGEHAIAESTCNEIRSLDEKVQARILLCRALIENHKGHREKAIEYLSSALSYKNLPPLLRAHILVVYGEFHSKAAPLDEASTLLAKEEPPSPQKNSLLRPDALYFSNFERRTLEDLPLGVTKATIQQALSDTKAHLTNKIGSSSKASETEKPPSLAAFELYKKGEIQKATELLTNALEGAQPLSPKEEARTLHLCSFLLALQGAGKKIEPFLSKLVTKFPIHCNTQELTYCRFLLSVILGEHKEALGLLELIFAKPEGLSENLLGWLRLEEVRLSAQVKGIEKKPPINPISPSYLAFINANQHLLKNEKKEALSYLTQASATEPIGSPLAVFCAQLSASIHVDFHNFEKANQKILESQNQKPPPKADITDELPELLFSEKGLELGLYPALLESGATDRQTYISSFLLPMIQTSLPNHYPTLVHEKKNAYFSYLSYISELYRKPNPQISETIDREYSLIAPAKPLSLGEQRIALLRAFISFVKGDFSEEELLLKEVVSSPSKEPSLPGASLFSSEKLFCKALLHSRENNWVEAERCIDELLSGANLSLNLRAHLTADKAYLLVKQGRPPHEIDPIIAQALALCQSNNTHGYLCWIQARRALLQKDVGEAFKHAWQGLQYQLSSKPITLMLLKVASSCSIKLQTKNPIIYFLQALKKAYNKADDDDSFFIFPDIYLQNAETRPLGIEDLSPGDFLPSALLEIASAHNFLGDPQRCVETANSGLKCPMVSSSLAAAFHIRKAIAFLQLEKPIQAKAGATAAIQLNPDSLGVLREAHNFFILTCLYLKEIPPQASLDKVIELSEENHPFRLDIGMLKGYFSFISGMEHLAEIQMEALLRFPNIPPPQHAYLLSVLAYFSKKEAPALLIKAKNLLAPNNPIHAIILLVALILERKHKIKNEIGTEVPEGLPPVLYANLLLEEAKQLLEKNLYKEAITKAKLGLASLTEKSSVPKIEYPFDSNTFSYGIATGSLIPCNPNASSLSSSLHFTTCKAFQNAKLYEQLFAEATQALKIPSRSSYETACYLYFQADAKANINGGLNEAKKLCEEALKIKQKQEEVNQLLLRLQTSINTRLNEWEVISNNKK